MAARHFVLDLSKRLQEYAIAALMKPVDTTRLVRDAGYIQGLQGALDLLKEVEAHNRKDDESK